MKTLIAGLIGLVFGVEVGAEPRVEGWVRLASGAAADGVQVRLFALTDLRQAISTTTDASGYFALSPRALQHTSARPERFSVGPNYPNPFNPATVIPYHLPTATQVRLEVFNVLGQRIATLVEGVRPAGFHTATWHGTNAAGHAVGAGLYIYRLSGGGQAVNGRMVLLDGQAGIPVAGRVSWATSRVREVAGVYGLTVSGQGLVPYVDPAFRVASDLGPVDLVVKARAEASSMKVAASGLFGDVNSDSRVDMVDALTVALYSLDPSIAAADNGAIALDDMNQDGQVDIDDALLLAFFAATSPDLIVQSPTVSDPSPSAGQAFTLSATIRNQGDGRSAGTIVRYYSSTDATITTSDTAVGKDEISALDASAQIAVSTRLTAPSSAGTYYYGACVDAPYRESDTTNNCSAAVEITVGAQTPGPDLVVQDAALSNSTPDAGTIFTLSATVRNQGDRPSAETTLRCYRSTDATIDTSDAEVGAYEVRGLVAGEQSTVWAGVLAPSSAGTYYYGACVDAVSEEGDIDNNCSAVMEIAVGTQKPPDGSTPPDTTSTPPSSGGSPDLVAQAFAFSTGTDPGTTFTLSATVRNQGDGPSEETTVRYYRSTDATIATSDEEVGAYEVRDLVPNDQIGVWAGVMVPFSAGTYYYGACVDSVPTEANPDNNCSAAVAITVNAQTPPGGSTPPTTTPPDNSTPPDTTSTPPSTGGGPDLVVTSPGVNDSSPDAGTIFTLSATVRNQGDRPSEETTLRFYHSNNATITTSDTEVGSDAMSGLDASDQLGVSTILTAPSRAGTHYYGVCVDSVPTEGNPDNNCSAAVAITVNAQTPPDNSTPPTTTPPDNSTPPDTTSTPPSTGGGPDLVVTSPGVNDSSPAAGTIFTLSATVRNQGDRPSEETTLRFYRSTDATITTSDAEVGSDAMSGLDASDQLGVSTILTAPSSAGTYYYGACVDSVPTEANSDNNCSAAVAIAVGTQTPPGNSTPPDTTSTPPSTGGGPDLVVTSPGVNDSSPAAGTIFTLSATVRNQGDGPSEETTLRFYRSTDATITTGDAEVGSDAMSGLDASDQIGVSTILTAPSSAGTYYYGACVDSVPTEANPDNNCSSAVAITVNP